MMRPPHVVVAVLASALMLSGCGGEEAAPPPASTRAPTPTPTASPPPAADFSAAPRNPFLAGSSWPIFHANSYTTASAGIGPGPVREAQIIGSLTSLLAPVYVSPWTVMGPRYGESREVVRPSPDLLYSLCAYDVSDSDILVKVGSAPGYWSISFYHEATNNFDVRRYGGGSEALRIFTISKGPMARQVVRSPSDRGLALIRRRVGNQEELDAAIDAQHEDDCGPLPSRAHALGSSTQRPLP